MVDFIEAEKRIDKILTGWFISDPILLHTACLCNRRPDKIDTIGLDIRGRTATLIYNPNFINSISMEKLELVLVTEYYKVLLRHCTTRLKEPRQISALSSSITINQLHNNNALLKEAMGDIDDITPNPSKFGLQEGQCFEEYYRNLMDKVNDTNEKIKQIWNSLTEEEKEKLANGNPVSGDGEGEGQGEGNGNPRDGYKDFSDQKGAMKDYYDPNGNSNQGWGESEMFDAEVKNMINNYKHSSKQWGKFTGNAMAEIIAANEPKISYKEILRWFKKSVESCQKIYTRMKINRRYDLEAPGSKHQYKSRVMFAVDVSGSMSDNDLAEGFAVINNLFKFSDVICVQFDTEIKNIERKFSKAKQSFKVHGRGGTDFQQIINLADKEKVDGLIIFTDGAADCPTPPKARLLWLLHSKSCSVPSGCDFGNIAYLERYESH